MERAVLHVDLDQFIVAVELLRRPELRGRPVLVGGTGDPARRGVVAGSSYEARAYGVRSGTPLRTAAARCPHAVFLPLDRDAYLAASAEFLATLRTITGDVEAAGWDEAFLLVEAADARVAARTVHDAVRARTGLECSVGIGDNKLRSKIASGLAKPAGVFRLDASNWHGVMANRPPAALWGIGRKTAARLAGLGIRTVGDLATADEAALAARFGPRTGPWLRALARGEDTSPVRAERPPARSHGREVTFQRDVSDAAALRAQVRRLAGQVAGELADEGVLAGRVVAKIRWAPFDTHTHGVRLDPPSRDEMVITDAALAALAALGTSRPVRLLGVRAEIARAPAREEPGASVG